MVDISIILNLSMKAVTTAPSALLTRLPSGIQNFLSCFYNSRPNSNFFSNSLLNNYMAFSLCNPTSSPAIRGGEAADETQDGVHSKLRQPWALRQHLCSHPWVSTPHPRPTWARTEGNYGTVMARSWSVYVGITDGTS